MIVDMIMSPGSNSSPTTGVACTSERLAAVNNLSLDALRIEWRQLYRNPPPRLSLDLMRRAIAYRIQEKAPTSAIGGIAGITGRYISLLLVANNRHSGAVKRHRNLTHM